MEKEKAVIYARVSSTNDRQSTERQVADLNMLAKSKSLTVVNTYEEHISGAKRNEERPILTECLSYCFSENVRNLLVSELSRLGRNVDEVYKNVMLAKEKGLNIIFQKESISIFDDNGKEHPFLAIFIAILGTMAQMERENISFRLQSGRANYVSKGGKLGRKKGYRKTREQKQKQYANAIKLLEKGYPMKIVAKMEGISISTVQRIKKEFEL